MAITKTIEIDVNSQAAEKDVNKLVEQFEDLGKASTKSIKNIEKGVENTEKSTKTNWCIKYFKRGIYGQSKSC
jgi:hypothetical protein